MMAGVLGYGAQEPELPTFSAATSAVVLDIVVRDKQGRVVRDLRAADFTVFEDDVEQTVESFQVVSRRGGRGAPASPEGPQAGGRDPVSPEPTVAAPPGEEPPAVVVLVFDRLTPSGRDFARRAALAYVDAAHTGGDIVGIFGLDLSLRSIEPFTADLDRIRAGIEKASRLGLASADRRQDRADVRRRLASLSRNEDQLLAATQGTGGRNQRGTGTTLGDLSGAISIERKAIEIERGAEVIERDQRGYATTRSLLAIVRALSGLRGRKTVVVFSEGLAIPAAVHKTYRSVIDTANRGNVSFYTVDAGSCDSRPPPRWGHWRWRRVVSTSGSRTIWKTGSSRWPRTCASTMSFPTPRRAGRPRGGIGG